MNKNLITLAMVLTLAACGSDNNDSQATFGGISEMSIDVSSSNYTDGSTSNLVVFDDDEGEDAFVAQTDTVTSYGFFSITSDGTWIYRLDDSNNDVAILPVGETLTDSFVVTSIDGTEQSMAITINGTHVLSAATFSGEQVASIAYNATSGITGTVIVTDANEGEDKATVQTDVATTYGSFSINEIGVWTYEVNTSDSDVSSLTDNANLTDTVAITSFDGTTSSIVITISGPVVGNVAATFSGDLARTIGNNITSDVTGNIAVLDLNDGESSIEVQSDFIGLYGSFSIDASGSWSYSLDDSIQAVSDLTGTDTLTESITISSADGTTTELVITITTSVANDQVVAITDEDDADSGEVRLALGDTDLGIDSVVRGKFTASFKKSQTLDSVTGEQVAASIILYGNSNVGGAEMVELLITDTYVINNTLIDLDTPVVEDVWTDIEITWDSTNVVDAADDADDVYPILTISVNGVLLTDTPFASVTSKIDRVGDGLENFKIKLGSSNAEIVDDGTLLVDDIAIYSTEELDGADVDTLVWSEDFESYTVGEALPTEEDLNNPTAYHKNSVFTEIQFVVGNGIDLP